MTDIVIRPASAEDAAPMADLLNEIIAIGGTTALTGRFDPARIAEMFLASPRFVSCHLAADTGAVLGFQALERGHGRLSEDWGSIASFVSPASHGRRIGRRLFEATKTSAIAAGLSAIDATILRHNAGGLAFYGAIGFSDYHSSETSISKLYRLQGDGSAG